MILHMYMYVCVYICVYVRIFDVSSNSIISTEKPWCLYEHFRNIGYIIILIQLSV